MADKTAVIEFTDYPDKSFTVRLSPVPLDDYLALNELLGHLSTPEDIRALVDRFAAVAFVGWTGYDEEPTPDNLRQRDFNLLMALVGQWAAAVAKAPLPLPRRPGSGGPSKARQASRSRQP